jgi:ADP-ribose pyrophosphatase YjhB (NUDIX family)
MDAQPSPELGPELRPVDDLSLARAIVAGYRPWSAAQAAERSRILAFIDAHPTDAHRRECAPGHLTAGTILVDAARERVLLHHHAKLDRWLQFGGHADGDGNLRGVAWRETVEESGIVPAWLSEAPIDVDVHSIPARPAKGARPAEPAHLHLDVRYLAIAPEGATAVRSEESHDLAWFTRADCAELALDDSIVRLVELALAPRDP